LRGQLSIENLHIPARLKRTVLSDIYDVRIDTAFADVIDGCASYTDERPKTWINKGIRDLFISLHQSGYAHSIECWQDGVLKGGLYGLALGGFFSGESMFSRARDASKVALVHLCARLHKGGFKILDTQFTNDHLDQFGVYEITREEYLMKLQPVLSIQSDFLLENISPAPTERALIRDYLA